MRKRRISVNISASTVVQLDAIARAYDQSRTVVINSILNAVLTRDSTLILAIQERLPESVDLAVETEGGRA